MLKQRIALLFVCSLFLSHHSRSASFDCNDLNFSKLQLSIHSFNFANFNTTRTPDGTAFQSQVVVRKKSGEFEVQSRKFFKKVYEPGHPDADIEGMVTYPNIDKSAERLSVSAAAHSLELMAEQGVCKTSILKNNKQIFIKYVGDKFPTSDFFTFKEDGTIESWTSYPSSGEVITIAF